MTIKQRQKKRIGLMKKSLAVLSIFCFFTLSHHIHASSLKDPIPATGKEIQETIMHNITTRNVRFKIPAGYLDTTNYSFNEKNNQEQLSVNRTSFDQPVSLDQLYKEKQDELSSGMGDKIKITEEGSANIAGINAKYMMFSFEDHGVTFFDRWAVVLLNPNNSILISYLTQNKDNAIFNHILSSLTLSETGKPSSATKGYTRRQAGHNITLDVPEKLIPPNTYSFASEDKQILLSISAYSPDENQPQMTLQDYINWDSGGGVKKIIGGEIETLSIKGGSGQQAKYVIDYSSHPYSPTVQATHRADIRVGETHLFLYGHSIPDLKEDLNIVWKEFTNSITPASTLD